MNPAASWPGLRFSKMHGAGNDFVVLDWRRQTTALPATFAVWLADRRRGVGCDQVLTIEAPRSPAAVLAYGIWNADGSPARQCGNGARCVAAWARRAGLVSTADLLMDSPAGPVRARFVDDQVEVERETPVFQPDALPFLGEGPPGVATIDGRAWQFGLVSMGNPHAVIEVDDVDAVAVARIGTALQADPRFPASCNVGFAGVLDRGRIRLRVFERGVGETLACGSGACAAVAWLRREGRVDAEVEVALPGGRLQIGWSGGSAPLRMRGPATFVFEGEIAR
jgi:diaminopimelate epimerase